MDKMTKVPRIDECYAFNMPDGHWIDRDGWEVWVKNGCYYRTDGPAIIFPDGKMEWCLDRESYSLDEWLELNNEITDSQKLLIKLKYG